MYPPIIPVKIPATVKLPHCNVCNLSLIPSWLPISTDNPSVATSLTAPAKLSNILIRTIPTRGKLQTPNINADNIDKNKLNKIYALCLYPKIGYLSIIIPYNGFTNQNTDVKLASNITVDAPNPKVSLK